MEYGEDFPATIRSKRLGSYSQTNFEYRNQFCFLIKKAATRTTITSFTMVRLWLYECVFRPHRRHEEILCYITLLQSMSNPELQGVDRIKKKKTTIIYQKESRKIEFALPTLAKHRTQTHAAPLE